MRKVRVIKEKLMKLRERESKKERERVRERKKIERGDDIWAFR